MSSESSGLHNSKALIEQIGELCMTHRWTCGCSGSSYQHKRCRQNYHHGYTGQPHGFSRKWQKRVVWCGVVWFGVALHDLAKYGAQNSEPSTATQGLASHLADWMGGSLTLLAGCQSGLLRLCCSQRDEPAERVVTERVVDLNRWVRSVASVPR